MYKIDNISHKSYGFLTVTLTIIMAFVLVIVGILGIFESKQVSAAPISQRNVSGWLPYWTTKTSTNAFLNNASMFTDVSPFWHDTAITTVTSDNPSGVKIVNNDLSYGTRSSVLAQLKTARVPIIPSVTDSTGKLYLSQVMKTPARRASFVRNLTALAVDNNYDGLDLDFEKFAFSDGSKTWATTRPAWISFIKEISASLHAKGKKLTVAVPPMYNSYRNGTSGYWVYDYAGMSPYVDRVRIMAYDYSWDTAGPIGGPLTWVKQLTQYALTQLPANKIQIGTPTYGKDWVTKKVGVGCPTLYTKVYDSSNYLTKVPQTLWKRDAASAERYASYTKRYNDNKCVVTRTVWMPDNITAGARTKTVSSVNRNIGIALWTVGGEAQGTWAAIKANR